MVSSQRRVQPPVFKVAHFKSGSFCDQVQSQASQVCVSSLRSVRLTGGCIESPLAGVGCLRLYPVAGPGQSGHSVVGPRLPTYDSDHAVVALHALNLGPGHPVCLSSTLATQVGKPNSAIHKPEPTCLAPRATAILKTGFL